MGIKKFMDSSEFKRTSGYVIEDSIKAFFRLVGIAFKALIEFIGSMFSMIAGK